jgi:glucosamine--fructose-6-phosphate aminotransferase (isomerizing)
MRFLFDEQVESQPRALQAVLDRPTPPLLDRSRPLLFVGQGSSLHAARVAAHWAGYPAQALEAHELALRSTTPRDAQIVAISHGGGGFTQAVLDRSATAIAVVGEQASVRAGLVLRTCAAERAETHSVSYTSALAVLARLIGIDVSAAPALMRSMLEEPVPDEAARAIAGRKRALVAGFGLDAISAEEAALKLKEACFIWAEGMSVEAALHGPHFALDREMAAILFDGDGGRTEELRRRCESAGVATFVLASPRCVELLRPFAHAVLAQRLAAEIARLTGGNPDTARPANP